MIIVSTSIGTVTREGVKPPVFPDGMLPPLPGVSLVLPRVPVDPDDMSDLMRAELERHRRELPALLAALPALAIALGMFAAIVAGILSGPPA